MPKAKTLPPLDLLRKLLVVDEETGETYRKFGNGKLKRVNHTTTDRYHRIRINEKLYPLHRILWALYNNELPGEDMVVDHINGDIKDNSKKNLRCVTYSENSWNTKVSKLNQSGVRGVTLYEGKKATTYEVRLSVNGVSQYLGTYKTLEEAISARIAAEKESGFYNLRE